MADDSGVRIVRVVMRVKRTFDKHFSKVALDIDLSRAQDDDNNEAQEAALGGLIAWVKITQLSGF